MEESNMHILNIDKKHKKEIDAFKKKVKKDISKQDKIFKSLCKKMKINPDQVDGDILFDHIFNDADFNVIYSQPTDVNK
jgi:hypothetical protein